MGHLKKYFSADINNHLKWCRLSERLRKVPPESLREFLNFLNFGGNLSKLTDTNSKTLW